MKMGSTQSMGGSKRRVSSKGLGAVLKEQRAKLYIIRRCVVMLLCWHDWSFSIFLHIYSQSLCIGERDESWCLELNRADRGWFDARLWMNRLRIWLVLIRPLYRLANSCSLEQIWKIRWFSGEEGSIVNIDSIIERVDKIL